MLVTYLHPDHLADAAIVERIRGMTERLGVEVFLRQNALDRKDGADVLRRLGCPVLVACGDSDRLTSLPDHEEMARLAPRARLVVIAGSGHMTPIENPGAVTAALRDWLVNGDSW